MTPSTGRSPQKNGPPEIEKARTRVGLTISNAFAPEDSVLFGSKSRAAHSLDAAAIGKPCERIGTAAGRGDRGAVLDAPVAARALIERRERVHRFVGRCRARV